MTQVTIAFVNPPKGTSNKGSIKTTNNALLLYDTTKFQFEKGAQYDVTTNASNYNGKTYHWVQTAKRLGGATASGDRWWMPFVSNTVAHAIAAACIVSPDQIKAWAAAAKQAALEIDEDEDGPQPPGGGDDQFRDDIPF